MLLSFNTHFTDIFAIKLHVAMSLLLQGCAGVPMVQNQVQEKHQYQNSAKGHHNRRSRRGINLNTL
jgi:hypothetical protein